MFKPISREEYHKKMNGVEILDKDNCPFCKVKDQEGHIIWKGKYFYLLYNLSSYSGDHRHIMAVPYDHIVLSKDLTSNHLTELAEVYKEVEKFFAGESYFSFTRETLLNRSVEHLHMHFLGGKLEGKFLRKMLELQGYPINQKLVLN
ncbi:HIT domain-containing protein [Candidatus Gracilibacteria bacterium]|nr:HIT domain-containing protein [Candidatus Gracilibacteria bacterium]